MIFKVFAKDELTRLFEVLSVNRVVGPVQKGLDRKNRPIYSFEVVDNFDDLRLDYPSTLYPAKRYFLPFEETLSSFTLESGSWEKHVDYNVYQPQVMFGMHACDINALNKLDKVLINSVHPTPYYASKRRNMFIIGIECMPQPHCFCRSMGADTVQHGFDMFLTDLGDRYFAEILSSTAYNYLLKIKTMEASETDHQEYRQVVREKSSKFTTHVDTTDLTKILDMEFQADVWKQWGDKCLSCGTCANVCPTCYCYGVQETVDMNLQAATKTKQLYSCNLIDFAEVAGGHNFRPEAHIRLKYRYYHKHRGFVEAFEESLCVGCGRCGESCLANINVPEVIASVRYEE
ncbi:MAG: hypothetical protein A2511_08285 [Deltaproteobacteria bacterium RIFOXYD12_FULL_50_9]|nr:MAG: hypothetical protein A2511_08285 [Deltaproteobacteria bacterium RIFOXYD12_FULL_50_9]